MICHKCGGQLPDDSLKCDRCGNALHSTQVAPPLTAHVPVTASITPQQQNVSRSLPLAPTPIPAQTNTAYLPASAGRRLANYILDFIVIEIIAIAIGTLVGMMVVPLGVQFIMGFIIGFLFVPLYYLVFESIFQRTIGKFITGTKVVSFDGSKPSFGQILGRSFARIVPFEAFSLLSAHPVGWHDRWPRTLVVSKSYTPEDVQKIDLANLKKTKMWVIITLVAVFLVSIFLVGIISSTVLASLNSARAKGRDARRVVDVKFLQLGLELYYGDHNAYPASLQELSPQYLATESSPEGGVPVEPDSGASYSYYLCNPNEYHLGSSLETQFNALDTDVDRGSLCAGDPINGDDTGKCVATDAGSYCYDVDSSSIDSMLAEPNLGS